MLPHYFSILLTYFIIIQVKGHNKSGKGSKIYLYNHHKNVHFFTLFFSFLCIYFNLTLTDLLNLFVSCRSRSLTVHPARGLSPAPLQHLALLLHLYSSPGLWSSPAPMCSYWMRTTSAILCLTLPKNLPPGINSLKGPGLLGYVSGDSQSVHQNDA